MTGAGGFIGHHLSELLLNSGHSVYGTIHDPSHVVYKGVERLLCDMRKRSDVEAAIEASKPERIFHLAAQSFPTVSWEQPVETFDVNVNGTIHVFETLKKRKINPVVVVACSSAEYGFVTPDEVPVKETHNLKPLHPYGVSKVAQDLLAYQYFKNFGLNAVRVRLFNTTGPGKTNDFCGDFTKQIVDIEKGSQKPVMLVGNLEPRRDVTDVRDMVEAFRLAAEKADMGDVYNLCSSKAHRVRDVLDKAVSMSKAKIEVKVDPAKIRPTDEPIIMGDNSKFTKKTGWKPKIPIDKTLEDMLDYWRNKQ
ncbi:MAG: GDP-mannose 4,6-dehydratase [Candidatus Altiarchaeota archaeon]|nr:GDP-mannose 4,6-dehydratase [Candidatus Altiarchaeota archaeon]